MRASRVVEILGLRHGSYLTPPENVSGALPELCKNPGGDGVQLATPLEILVGATLGGRIARL